jgi:hypothetical protein
VEKQLPAWIAITVAKENFQDLYDVHLIQHPFAFNNARSILKLEMRSASRSNITAAAEAGNQSVYTVTFFSGIGIIGPPLNSIVWSNLDHTFAPLNIICSKKMRKTSNTLILVATPYFVEQIHISVWEKSLPQPILSSVFRVKVFTSSVSFVLFLLGRAKEKAVVLFFSCWVN